LVEPEVQEAGLQAIAEALKKLVEEAQKIEQPLLAYMLDLARLEAKRELQKFKN